MLSINTSAAAVHVLIWEGKICHEKLSFANKTGIKIAFSKDLTVFKPLLTGLYKVNGRIVKSENYETNSLRGLKIAFNKPPTHFSLFLDESNRIDSFADFPKVEGSRVAKEICDEHFSPKLIAD